MRTYETVFILDPDLSEEDTEKSIKRIHTIIEGQKGKIVLWDRWGKRKLAYRVKKKMKGNYVRVVYYGESKIVAILERNMRIMEEVLKFLTIILADKEIEVTIEEKKEEVPAVTEMGARPAAAPASEPVAKPEDAAITSAPDAEEESPLDAEEAEADE